MTYSVGIPVRNEENTLESCLESLISQTLAPSEILICVNGSTDNTYNIAKGLSRRYDLVKVLESEPGKPNAWNKIVSSSQYDRIMFIDGDVLVDNNSAKYLNQKLDEEPELEIVSGTFQYREPDKHTFFSKFFIEKYNRPIEINFLTGQNYIMNRKKLLEHAKELDIELMEPSIINEDYLLELITKTNKNRFVNENKSFVTIHPSLSLSDWLKVQKRIIEGSIQIQMKYPQLRDKISNTDLGGDRMKNYLDRLNQITSIRKKLGMISLFGLRNIMKMYYSLNKNSLSFNNQWDENKSSKKSFDYFFLELISPLIL